MVIVGLVQLKRIPRIISVILFSVASLLIIKIIVTILYIGSNHTLRTYISFSVMLAINIGCIWYLLRKKTLIFHLNTGNMWSFQKKLRQLNIKSEQKNAQERKKPGPVI